MKSMTLKYIKKIFITLFPVLLLLGCDSQNDAANTDPLISPAPEEKELSLEERLVQKYSKLQLRCNFRGTIEGKNSELLVEQNDSDIVFWDILEDFSLERSFEHEFYFEGMHNNFQLSVAIDIVDNLNLITTTEDLEERYRLVNAIMANAAATYETDYNDEDSYQFHWSEETILYHHPLYDRIATSIIYREHSIYNVLSGDIEDLIRAPRDYIEIINNSEEQITCLFDAEVYPEYDTDFFTYPKRIH